MDCIQVDDVKTFMGRLLLRNDFDQYYLQEAEIVTGNTFHIQGKVEKKFYSAEEYEEMGSPDFTRWEALKPLCFEIIKGQKTPVRFKIILKYDEKRTKQLLEQCNTNLTELDVSGLYLNIVYEEGKLNCITATTLNIFTMDKALEKAWDVHIRKEIG